MSARRPTVAALQHGHRHQQQQQTLHDFVVTRVSYSADRTPEFLSPFVAAESLSTLLAGSYVTPSVLSTFNTVRRFGFDDVTYNKQLALPRHDFAAGAAPATPKSVVRVENSRTHRKKRDNFFAYTDALPSEPPSQQQKLPDELTSSFEYKLVAAEFETRPIWLKRRFLQVHLSTIRQHHERFKFTSSNIRDSFDRITRAFNHLCYSFTSGPWRGSWIRLGYDPRVCATADDKLRNARLQALDYRMPPEYAQPLHRALAEKEQRLRKEYGRYGAHMFEDTDFSRLPTSQFSAYQLLDIADAQVQSIVNDVQLTDQCSLATGWVNPEQFKQIRDRLKRLQQERMREMGIDVDALKPGQAHVEYQQFTPTRRGQTKRKRKSTKSSSTKKVSHRRRTAELLTADLNSADDEPGETRKERSERLKNERKAERAAAKAKRDEAKDRRKRERDAAVEERRQEVAAEMEEEEAELTAMAQSLPPLELSTKDMDQVDAAVQFILATQAAASASS